MGHDATGSTGRAEVLAAAVAGYRETLTAALAHIARDFEAGKLTAAQRDEQAAAASARCECDCELARIAAETGWHTWRGTVAVVYASRPKTSPPVVVRGAIPAELREAIATAEAGRLA